MTVPRGLYILLGDDEPITLRDGSVMTFTTS
jgi:hypothetical protein